MIHTSNVLTKMQQQQFQTTVFGKGVERLTKCAALSLHVAWKRKKGEEAEKKEKKRRPRPDEQPEDTFPINHIRQVVKAVTMATAGKGGQLARKGGKVSENY